METCKQFVLFVRCKYDDGDEFWYGWKTYRKWEHAKQAFETLQKTKNNLVPLLPVGKIVDSADNGTSFIG